MLRILLVALAAFVVGPTTSGAQDGFFYDRSDSEMNAAHETARRTLPDFLKAMRDKSGSRYSVKVPIEEGSRREHLWLIDLRIEGDEFVGVVENTPNALTEVRKGSSRRLKQADISDWIYFRDGLAYGAFTVRVMLKKMSKEDADRIRATLAP